MRLEIKGVSKIFKNTTALHPFFLEVNKGECIALCGGNGAGKSTLLYILAGISTPKEGTVIIDQVDIHKDLKSYVSSIGYMPDEFQAQEALTIFEFLSFYGSFRKVRPDRIKEVIQIIGLEGKEKEQIKHLSKGMRQRLLFGQAWMANPAVLILDEPTNGLDPYWIDVFIDLLKKIKANGTTILFSTHMMDVAAEVADKVVFMEDGMIMETLINDYQNPKNFTEVLLRHYRKKDIPKGVTNEGERLVKI